jgi:hypothetical protein
MASRKVGDIEKKKKASSDEWVVSSIYQPSSPFFLPKKLHSTKSGTRSPPSGPE